MPRLNIGSRAQVMHGTAKMTGGGLRKKDLKYNKRGKIVSRKASRVAKKANKLVKAGYVTRKGVFGVVKRGGMNAKSDKVINEAAKEGIVLKKYTNGYYNYARNHKIPAESEYQAGLSLFYPYVYESLHNKVKRIINKDTWNKLSYEEKMDFSHKIDEKMNSIKKYISSMKGYNKKKAHHTVELMMDNPNINFNFNRINISRKGKAFSKTGLSTSSKRYISNMISGKIQSRNNVTSFGNVGNIELEEFGRGKRLNPNKNKYGNSFNE